MTTSWNAEKLAEALNKMITAEGAIRHQVLEPSGPRVPLQRERDRIVWCPSFRRLAHKTQVFPHAYGDHHRMRLTHCLEVMQLSTSIARSLGLNFILCEAIALGHDLGHTPFGHAGESALDCALENLEWKPKPRCLSRFTHYEHGVDVVSYIDSPDPDGNVEGLKLSLNTVEGIFKHTYDHSGPNTKHKSLAFLLKHTKYTFADSAGSLEAQAVRICDKLSYFISDIDDGLRIGAIHIDDLMEHPILKAEIQRVVSGGLFTDWRDFRVFFRVRDHVLTTLVDSVLKQSEANLSRPPGKRPQIVISLGPCELEETRRIYQELQKGRIFRHYSVDRANKRAQHIVSCLFCQYLRYPELVPWHFRRRYLGRVKNFYDRLCSLYETDLDKKVRFKLGKWLKRRDEQEGVSCVGAEKIVVDHRIGDLICVKDYVAGMTDQFAEEQFEKQVDCFPSRQAWNKLGRIPSPTKWR